MEKNNILSPEFVPEELSTPYDILELPSQGILYPNKKKSIKVEYLTALDETILTSPNIIANNKVIDTLLERKVKDLGFDHLDLIEGDRTAIIIFLRATGFGEEYKQLIYNPETDDYEEGTINLSELTHKKLTVNPDENGLFDYELPISKNKVKFKFLTGRDEKIIEDQDNELMKRNNTDISTRLLIKLERQVMSINGETDKIKISNLLKKLKIMDSRSLRKYIEELEPGINMSVNARTRGGESVPTFLTFNRSFFWPEL
tara:strand:- start:2665 stop:3441 length:777 start_codon:yes stop_codon:yes gene_type:complete